MSSARLRASAPTGVPTVHADPALDDPVRLRLLSATGLVEASSAARVPTLDRIARLAARATRASLAQVNLLSADAQIPAAAFVDARRAGPGGAALSLVDSEPGGRWRTPVGLDASYCQHVVRTGSPLVIDDTALDPLVRDNRATREGRIAAYAATPVVSPSGEVLGTVCVVDFESRQWTEADVETLGECAALAGEEIAARLATTRLIRDSEKRLDLAVRAGRLGPWSLDCATGTLSASAECREHHGRGASASFDYDDLLGAVHADDRPRLRAAIARSIAHGAALVAEYRVVAPDGAERWLAVFGQRVTEGAQATQRLVGLTQDITDRRAAEVERERLLAAEQQARADSERARLDADLARLEAEQANRAKSEFLAVMSHELRTPLNAIGGYTELLELGLRGPLTDPQRQDLARIKVSQRHLLGLINEVLNFTKLETGAVRYDLRPVRVCESLAETESLIGPQAQGKGIVLDRSGCADDLAVVADADKLRQILTNVLSNAVKFTERGGRIDVSCAATETAVAIRVRDTGLGIPAAKLASIFEPFVQVRADLTRTAEGMGLGLAISRDLARGMDGELTVESTVGIGSTFAVTLPRAVPGD